MGFILIMQGITDIEEVATDLDNAKRRDVKKIFLLEALIMGMFAAMVGIWMAESLGSVINGVIKELMKESAFYIYQMNSPVLIGAFIGVVTLCLLAGYFPAKRAASVDPIEVLRIFTETLLKDSKLVLNVLGYDNEFTIEVDDVIITKL